MKGYEHLIIFGFMMLGGFLGNCLIDLDHRPFDLKLLWRGWKGEDLYPQLKQGVLHKPIVMLSIIAFSISLGLGVLLHMLADFRWVR